jgi:sulfate adenylyltransferase subunit 2
MGYLQELESKSIYTIREAYRKYKNIAALWSIGKDSTTLLWLCRKAFYGQIPFPVVHIDTGYKFKEIYEFRDRYAKEWDMDLVIAENKKATLSGVGPEKNRFRCCNALKTEALKAIIEREKFDALLLGIRRDEHGVRAKERYFSPRDKDFKWNVAREKKGGDSPFEAMQDTELSGWNLFGTDFGKECSHVRVHPLLHWGEIDIWKYTKKERIPAVSLYFAKDGKRYRSIGCQPCCQPIESDAKNIGEVIAELEETKVEERIGRAQDKEYMMEKLRHLGYM